MLHLSDHPLVQHKVALLRDVRTEPMSFRALVGEIAQLLFYELRPWRQLTANDGEPQHVQRVLPEGRMLLDVGAESFHQLRARRHVVPLLSHREWLTVEWRQFTTCSRRTAWSPLQALPSAASDWKEIGKESNTGSAQWFDLTGRIAMVTGGSGASTGFAMGEEVIADLFGGALTDRGRAG